MYELHSTNATYFLSFLLIFPEIHNFDINIKKHLRKPEFSEV